MPICAIDCSVWGMADLNDSSTSSWVTLSACTASAALSALAFPGIMSAHLVWVALVPMFLSYQKGDLKTRQGFILGWITGAGSWVLYIWWMPTAIAEKLEADILVVGIVFVTYCLYAGLPFALHGGLHTYLGWGRRTRDLLLSAAVLALLVDLQPLWLKWSLAHALYRQPVLIQMADLGGVPFVFGLIVVINSLIAYVFAHRAEPLCQVKAFFVFGIILVGILIYGNLRLIQYPITPIAGSRDIVVGMVQPNFPRKLTPGGRIAEKKQAFAKLAQLTKVAANFKPKSEIILWPELAFPFSWSENTDNRRFTLSILNVINGTPLLISSSYEYVPRIQDTTNPKYYNALDLVTPEGSVGTYHKRRLTPFGEKLPGEDVFPWLSSLFPGFHRYQAGMVARVFPLKPGVIVLPLICYEAVFPKLVKEGLDLGGNLMMVPANDSWMDNPIGAQRHLALSLFRTIEFRRPMVRVTNSGISAFVDAAGRILPGSRIPMNEPGWRVARVWIPTIRSFYARFNHVLQPMLVVIVVLMIFRQMKRPSPC